MEEVPVTQFRLADGVDIGQPGQQFAEGGVNLTAGQLCAEAVVDTAAAESDVLVRRPLQVQLLGMVEDLGIHIGR